MQQLVLVHGSSQQFRHVRSSAISVVGFVLVSVCDVDGGELHPFPWKKGMLGWSTPLPQCSQCQRLTQHWLFQLCL